MIKELLKRGFEEQYGSSQITFLVCKQYAAFLFEELWFLTDLEGQLIPGLPEEDAIEALKNLTL